MVHGSYDTEVLLIYLFIVVDNYLIRKLVKKVKKIFRGSIICLIILRLAAKILLLRISLKAQNGSIRYYVITHKMIIIYLNHGYYGITKYSGALV